MQRRATHLDLFSGIGGFAIAAQNCGYETVAFCEKEKYAQQILKERFGAVLADAESGNAIHYESKQKRRPPAKSENRSGAPRLHPNIFTLNGDDYAGVDLLTGGFPCQPFSVAGKRKGAADDRALWPEMLRVIDGAKPAWLIGENVAGIVTMELDNILSDLEGIGYSAWPLVIPACAVDARHRRDRVWIVAHAEELHGNERGEYRQSSERQVSESGISSCCEWESELHWFAESGMGRVAHGIPHRAHRLRGLGNAIVPQVAYEIIRAIPPHIPGREIALAKGAGMR
jgi:DNA (cytosine-5)-methyltransferase 1